MVLPLDSVDAVMFDGTNDIIVSVIAHIVHITRSAMKMRISE